MIHDYLKLAVIMSFSLLGQKLYAQEVLTLYNQLVQVNEQWKNQPDIEPALQTNPSTYLDGQKLVQFHLAETEKLLRKRNTNYLSSSQRKSREATLNTLHSYWQNGIFPTNDKYVNRQPCFIDKYNTYCAVGYLMQQSGADEIAKDISKIQNYSYLSDIFHPAMMKWVAASGLTLDELALIQPGYGGEWPATITEMNYNNTGNDVNEYIEVHQSNGGLIGMQEFSTILFYDYSGNLYKTLSISEMNSFNRNNTENNDSFFYYLFPTNENFADSGKIELRGASFCASTIISAFYYNSSGIKTEEFACRGTNIVKQFTLKEDETTPPGNSITFCGLYNSTWNPTILPATPGALNACTKGALPVTLSSFNYNISDKTVQLKWQTASESNNDYFDIERSNNGINFHSIGKVKGAGTSGITKNYSFIDKTFNYINHYRLKQVDLDGRFSYSKILFVKVPKSNPLVLLQNVVTNNLQVQIYLPQTNIGSFTVYDFMGRESLRVKATPGSQNINISSLSKGKYLIRLFINDGEVYNSQFIKQ